MAVELTSLGWLQVMLGNARHYDYITMEKAASQLHDRLVANDDLPDLTKLSKSEQRQLIYAACRFYQGHGAVP